MFGRTRLDLYAVLGKDIRGPQDIVAVVDPKRNMVEPSMCAFDVLHIGSVGSSGPSFWNKSHISARSLAVMLMSPKVPTSAEW